MEKKSLRKIPVFVKHYAPGAKYEVRMSMFQKLISSVAAMAENTFVIVCTCTRAIQHCALA